jgi:Putative zinc-finger
MNCAESQDLLLDLAYGELPPDRVEEVEAHVVGCAACSAEKAQLDQTRKAVAPLRELEEPPEAFDEPILRAARAEAGLQADGTPGPVVEVSASVKPLGLQAARLDPHARTSTGKARQRPRWGRRAAVFASIAAAAGLAVVVTSSLRRNGAEHAAEEVAPIQVRAPGAAVPNSLDDALGVRGKAAAPEKNAAGQTTSAAPQTKSAPDQKKKGAASQTKSAAPETKSATPETKSAAPAMKRVASQREIAQPSPARPAEPVRNDVAKAAEPKTPPPGAVVGGQMDVAQAGPANPDQLEEQAGTARRRGEYPRAAALYRDASALRKQLEPARAAWDMAHAVECLAAGGQLAEAVAARKELLRSFPDHAGPKAAADSALRSFRLPPDDEKK